MAPYFEARCLMGGDYVFLVMNNNNALVVAVLTLDENHTLPTLGVGRLWRDGTPEDHNQKSWSAMDFGDLGILKVEGRGRYMVDPMLVMLVDDAWTCRSNISMSEVMNPEGGGLPYSGTVFPAQTEVCIIPIPPEGLSEDVYDILMETLAWNGGVAFRYHGEEKARRYILVLYPPPNAAAPIIPVRGVEEGQVPLAVPAEAAPE